MSINRVFLGAFVVSLATVSPVRAQPADLLGIGLIVVATGSQAGAVAARLAQGEPFDELARQYSIDPSAATGGYLGTITASELRGEYQTILKPLAPGGTSRIEAVDGRYVLLRRFSAEETLIAASRAGHTEVVRRLVERGTTANAKAADGTTALMEAARAGHSDIVPILIGAGADTNASYPDRSTVLMASALSGRADIVGALIRGGADVNAKASNGSTALIEASYAGHREAAGILMAAGADVNAHLADGSTALMAAALAGHAGIVGDLAKAGAEVNARAANDSTALIEAAYPGHLETVRILLAAGADPNAKLGDGWTALMAAALGGHLDLVRVLLEAGADLNARNHRGWTALMHAVGAADMTMVKALLDGGAEVTASERSVYVGSLYVNEYYSSNAVRLLDLAATEFQRALAANPGDPGALAWMAATEVLRWDERLDLKQFRTARALLDRCLQLDPDKAERHYWIAATSWIFALRGKGATAAEYVAIVDEGIQHASKALEIDPAYADALVYLSALYRRKADFSSAGAERDALLQRADAVYQDSLEVRNEAGPRDHPDDVFRPAPPPPPAPPFDDGFPFGRPLGGDVRPATAVTPR
jgi:ankyrin repeat protein